MKFAYFSHVWNRPDMVPAERYDQLWRELALADDLGFDYGFAVEHHFLPHESWMTSPTVFCTGGAANTRNIRLGPMGYIVPLYDPIRILEEAAVLDHVLHGRLELGLVSGIAPEYFNHYTHYLDSRAETFEKRRHLTMELIPLVKAAFASEGPFSFDGPYHHYDNVKLSVKPQQKPHPPMWVQSRDLDTLRFLAQEGVHTGYILFLPREEAAPRYREYLRLWEQAGHSEKPNISYWTLVYVDETDEAAVKKATPHIVHAFSQVFGVGDAGFDNTERLIANYEKRGEWGSAEIARNMSNVEYLLDRGLVFVGSPQTVAKKLKEASQEGLFNSVFAEMNLGWLPEADLMRSIRLFGDEVMPALREFEPY
jgi:alkanesulfonate monooxygenase SsuD/methylene tetrahydromethanopterin reductase-like flavin-dependent oxidoreductase (luciferase family)